MAIFAVIGTNENPQLVQSLQQFFPGEHLKIGNGQWFISSRFGAKEISDSLGITDGRNGAGIVIAVGSYFGRASAEVWDWMSSRLQRIP